jgi:hypothetical protein
MPGIERLIKGVVKAYKSMLQSQNIPDEQITERIDALIDRPQIKKKRRLWFFLQKK